MIIYNIIFFSILTLSLPTFYSLHKTKLSNVIYFAISILLIMFAAFRGDIDRDHQNYINIYGYILNGQLYLIEPTFIYSLIFLNGLQTIIIFIYNICIHRRVM